MNDDRLPPGFLTSGGGIEAETAIDPLARLRHDLRTPAAHIQGYAEMLQEEATSLGLSGWLPDLRRIETAGRRLVESIRRELAPERLSQGSPDLRDLRAELRTPLNHAVGYAEILIEQAGGEPAARLLPDLERIRRAAGDFLQRLDILLVPESFPTTLEPRDAVTPTARPEALALARSADHPSAAVTPLKGGSLLIVDDDAGNRDLLARRLEREGYETIAVEDGQAAFRVLRTRSVDLVLLDMIMPGINGEEILAQLKADAATRDLPVIMLSALDEMDSVVRCILIGAEDYLARPYNPVLLRARINAGLEKSRLRRQEQAYLKALEIERQKTESLLRNILPVPIVNRLKRGETTIVDSLAEVTVLFADVVGFSSLSRHISSVDLVRLLDDLFTSFDGLAEQQGLEKIKTIGDAYMVVGGLPAPRADHAVAVAELGLAMLAQVEQMKDKWPVPLQIRLGMNSGPVVAGIIGRSKFSYDLWGDTVNLASRMESLGQPGRLHITEAVHARLGDRYVFEPRGTCEVKGRGPITTWFLTGRSPVGR